MRALATVVAAVALALPLAAQAGAAAKPTWKANATPAWSRMLTGFQVSFFRHKHKLGIETPNWVTLRCTPPGGARSEAGGFGIHLEKKGQPAPARYGKKSVKGKYQAKPNAPAALEMPPNVPPPARASVAFDFTKRSRSLKGTLTVVLEWDGDSPYSRCTGAFKVIPF